MHRYRSLTRCLLSGVVALAAAACSVPSARDNADVAAQLVRGKARADLEWRRDPAADEAARTRATALLADGVTLDDAVNIAFLIHPSLQIALEQLAISRAELVAAVTPPNPVVVAGSRKPGGNLAAFYPERAVSVGMLESVLALLNMPDRVAIARSDLERARYDTAQQAVQQAAEVVQAWLEYCAAVQVHALNQRSAGDTLRSGLNVAVTRARLGQAMGTIGWRDDWEVTIPLPPAPAADPDLAAIETQAMQQRLDLKVAEKAVDVRLKVLALRRHFRWLGQLDVGVFRDQAIGGTPFTGPNVVIELPLLNQRIGEVLQADSELRIAMRKLETARLAARAEVQVHVAELRAMRQQLQQFGAGPPPANDPRYVETLREYWRTRSALALSAGDWVTLSGL